MVIADDISSETLIFPEERQRKQKVVKVFLKFADNKCKRRVYRRYIK